MRVSELEALDTEQINESSRAIDRMSALEIATLMNQLDRTIPDAIRPALPQIGKAIDAAEKALRNGGRMLYVGAGTSGRLGVLDASECPPTFGVAPGTVMGLIAGGERALTDAVEGAEDDEEQAVADLKACGAGSQDLVIGITASGRTPYVCAALQYAKSLGCTTVSVSCVRGSRCSSISHICIEAVTGAEVITGSTRLRAGTATKMILNMISTGAMVRMGKVYGNLMVDLAARNEKLYLRCIRILREAAGIVEDEAVSTLKAAKGDLKAAILMAKEGCSREEALSRLKENGGRIRDRE